MSESEQFPAPSESSVTLRSKSYGETVRRRFKDGLVIECDTTVNGDDGLAESLSHEADKKLLTSPSVWRFMGPSSAPKAETITRVLNMYAQGRGPYAAWCVDGTTDATTPDGTRIEEPFSAVIITGPADQVTQEQVTAFSLEGANKMNELLKANNLGFELPLPADAQNSTPTHLGKTALIKP